MRKKETVKPIPNKLPTLETTPPTRSAMPESLDKRPISARSSVNVPLVEFNDSVIESRRPAFLSVGPNACPIFDCTA